MNIKIKALHNHYGELSYGDKRFSCAIGKSGITGDKKEGDHASPAGLYPLKKLYYRPDKHQKPVCVLPTIEIKKNDGWCDDPNKSDYNKPVSLPYEGSCEIMWRDDDLYDLVVVIGHNDEPPLPGKGSCIFMHVAKGNYEGTEGCVALKKQDLLALLSLIELGNQIEFQL